MRQKIPLIILCLVVCCTHAAGQIITTICGDGTLGTSSDGMQATIAWVGQPQGVVKFGDKIYYCESAADKVRYIGADGLISTVAGTGVAGYSGDGGLAINAKIYSPGPLTVDNAGNIYFVDQNTAIVRKISTSGIITTVAGNLGFGYSGDGGPAILAQFRTITGICVDNAGNLYIADWWSSVVRKVNLATGIVTTVAGTGNLGFTGDGGPALAANLNGPYSVAADNAGNLYISDADNKRIRKVNAAGIITTIAGTGVWGNTGDGGSALTATFNRPLILTTDATNNLYVYDTCGVIRKITTAGIISRVAGTGVSGYTGDGGPPLSARISGPEISVDAAGILYISDFVHNRIRIIHCPEIIMYDQSMVDTSICLAAGTTAHFFIDVDNATNYQWQVNIGTGWTNITNNAMYAGATTPNLDITGIIAGMNNYQYRCRAYNNCSEFYCNPINMQVSAPLMPSVAITASTNNICPGTSVTFTATSTNVSSPYYIWIWNGYIVSWATNTFSTSYLHNGDIIQCEVLSNDYCSSAHSAVSNTVTISVNLPGPSIAITASSTNICPTTSVTFTANVTNPGTSPVYQWTKNGLNVGTNSSTYTNNTWQNGDVVSCSYSATTPCGISQVISNPVTMTVSSGTVPTIYIRADGGCIWAIFNTLQGDPSTYYADITNGGSAPFYQWKRNGINVGGNSNTYTATLNDGDVISCTLTSNSPCVTTTTANSNVLIISLDGTLDITQALTITSSTDMCTAGVPVTFTATSNAPGTAPLFEWRKNGILIGTNSGTFTDNAPAQGDMYSCIFTSNQSCVSQRTVMAYITYSCTECDPFARPINTIINVSTPRCANIGYGGNLYYSTGSGGNQVKMLTPAGATVTLAGTGAVGNSGDGGLATAAQLNNPRTVVAASDGTIYFIDQFDLAIRKITPAGIISTIATTGNTGGDGSPLNTAQFSNFADITLDNAGNLYIADFVLHCVKKVNLATSITTIVAGQPLVPGNTGDGGPATLARLAGPEGVAVDNAGNIYIVDNFNRKIRKINAAGTISTFAGNGTSPASGDGGLAINAGFSNPNDVAVDNAGNVYVADFGVGIRRISTNGLIITVAGNGTFGYSGDGGPATAAQTVSNWVSVDDNENIYITDYLFNAIRKVSCAPVAITHQPVDTLLCNPPGDISFSVKACNATSYQWEVNTGSGWINAGTTTLYSGTATSKLTITGATLAMNNYQYRCRVYSACNTVFSQPALLKVKVSMIPSVTINTVLTTLCQGANGVFNATPVNGGLTPAYQWKKNGVNVGTNSNTYTDNTLVNGDLISCVLTISPDECTTTSAATSNTITAVISPVVTPTITINASANNICGGTPVTFTLTSTNAGTAPFYQWQKNGVNVAAGTTYTDNTLVTGDVIHCALISNAPCVTGSGLVFSNNVTMNIVAAVTPTIAITSSGNNVCAGSPVTFNSTITNGGAGPVYQWKKNGVNVGTNNNSYTDITLNNGDIITCVLTSNSVCATIPTATSNGVTMIINPVTPPSINIAASTNTICAGTPVTFTSSIANGGGTPVYQWKKNGVNVGTNNNTYSDNALNNGDIITCILTPSATCAVPATATSNTITMTVNALATPLITITSSGNSICTGTPVTFFTNVTNAGGSPIYQWKKNGVNVGIDNNSYSDNTISNGDVISCVLTSIFTCATPATVTSNTLTMIVNPLLAPTISIAGSANNICAGTPVTFSTTITNGGAAPVYQWKKNGVNVGTNNNTYSDNALNNADVVTCVLNSNAVCATPASIGSNSVTMVVNPVVTPTLSVTASSTTICAGTPVTFSSAITNGGTAPVYQWKKNGVNVGTNSNNYTDNTLNNSDIISCVLTSNQVCRSANTAISNNITMTVNPLLIPSITVAASGNTICAGTNVNFTTVITNGGAIPSYQWKLNGSATGINSSTYSSAALNNNDIITCELTSGYACAVPALVISNPVQMRVDPVLTPAVTISIPDNSICTGLPGIFNAAATNAGASLVYEWKKNGVNVGINSPVYTDNGLNNNDAITCKITATANCLTATTANSNIITMTIYNNPVVMLDQTPTLCTGAVRQLDAGAFSFYTWNNGQTSRTINVNSAGTYSVIVTDNNGCNGNGLTTITTMLPQPNSFLPLDTSFCNFGSLTLKPYYSYNSYAWSTGATSQSITTNQPGTYWLEVTDNNDCEGRSSVYVIMNQCLKGLYVPNAFTPNNDGKNDVFKPQLFGDIKKYEFILYNRWGNLVFRTTNPGQGWDGRFQGVETPTQVFVWICTYQLNGEAVKVEKGTVTLIR